MSQNTPIVPIEEGRFTLTYIRLEGRALAIRLAFHLRGMPFEDVRLSMRKWGEAKTTTPWGHIPTLRDGEHTLFDSVAILLHVADPLGLIAQAPIEKAQSLAIMNAIDDEWENLGFLMKTKNPFRLLWWAKDFLWTRFPSLCEKLEAQLKGPFFMGDELSAVDLSVYALLSVILGAGSMLRPEKILNRYEILVQWMDRVGEIEQVKTYMDNRTSKA